MFIRAGLLARVGVSVAALSLVDVAVASGADRAAAELKVGTPSVNARWQQGWLRPGAAVLFSGTVDAPSSLQAALRPVGRPGVVTAVVRFDVAAAGSFSERLSLPPRALPGRYGLRISGTSGTAQLTPVNLTVTIPAPPEGVLDNVEVGTTPNGPWLLYKDDKPPVLRGSHSEIFMRYTFLYPPTGKDVELVWKLHWHRIVGRVYKRYKDTLITTVSSKTPLPSGHWLSILKVDNRISKRMDVVLG